MVVITSSTCSLQGWYLISPSLCSRHGWSSSFPRATDLRSIDTLCLFNNGCKPVYSCDILGKTSRTPVLFSRSASIGIRQGSLRRVMRVSCAGKGFGELLQKNKKLKPVEKVKVDWCPCGNGIVLNEYIKCCGQYHDGGVEPDPLTLLKARYSAYVRGIVPYIVRTTSEKGPDYEDGKLEEAVRLTCERARFTKLEITETKIASENEAFVSFKAFYSPVGKSSSKGHGRILEEKSRFIKQGDRWLYCDSTPLTQASEVAWRNF